MDLLFFLLHLLAAKNMTCIAQYENVCEISSFGTNYLGLQVGETIYIRYGMPEIMKGLVLKHERCHVEQYRQGRRGEGECYDAMWN